MLVPIVILISIGTLFVEKLDLQIDITEGQWYILNLRQAGFYRVNYDEENWKLLTQSLYNNHMVCIILSIQICQFLG